LGGFGPAFILHPSSFILHFGVALGAVPAISSFFILHSAFAPVWLYTGTRFSGARPSNDLVLPADHRRHLPDIVPVGRVKVCVKQ
jgi:hypothetical protein